MRSGEADAVRQARDAALWLGVALAPLAGVALLMGALTADFGLWLRWLLGPALAALLLLLTLCFALLAVNNLVLAADVLLLPTIDLTLLQMATSLGAVAVMLFGFVWEVR